MWSEKPRSASICGSSELRTVRAGRGYLLAAIATMLSGCSELPTASGEAQRPARAVVSPSSAESFSGSGTMTITGATLISSKVANGNRFFTRSISGAFTGTLSGTYTSVITITQRDNGIETLHGTRVFTGTIAGRSGSCVIKLAAAGVVGTSFLGHLTITTCTGGLEGLHGHATFQPIGFGVSSSRSCSGRSRRRSPRWPRRR
jgi:hypothetical protein